MEAAQSSRRSLGDILVERGLLSEADLERAVVEQFETKRRLADILVRRGLVTGHDITSALNEQFTSFQGSASQSPSPASDLEPEPAPGTTHEDAAEKTDTAAAAGFVLHPVVDVEDDPETGEEPDAVAETDEQTTADESDPELLVEPEVMLREADRRRSSMESTLSALGPILTRVEHIQADLDAHDLSTPLLSDELTATRERLIAKSDSLSTAIAQLRDTREQIERTAGVLESLRTELAEKNVELTDLRTTAAIWTGRVADMEAEVESLTTRADGATRELNAFAAAGIGTSGADEVVDLQVEHDPSTAEGHVLFVPTDDGYELVERPSEAPGVGTVIDAFDQRWLVTRVGASPLPFDDRQCAFLTAPEQD